MQVVSDVAPEAHQFIESNRNEDIQRLKQIISIPSIAADNPDGVRKCAELMLSWLKELECAEAEIVETEGSPVVYGHYDAGAKNTLLVYMMYDVKQVAGEDWTLIKDPFKPELLPLAPFRKVLVGRGAYNSKGPLAAFLNSLRALKAVGKELPVNLKFIAEGEEELGSQHLIDFAKQYERQLRDVTAGFAPSASQNIKGVPSMYLGAKGVVELELECSGEILAARPH